MLIINIVADFIIYKAISVKYFVNILIYFAYITLFINVSHIIFQYCKYYIYIFINTYIIQNFILNYCIFHNNYVKYVMDNVYILIN